MLAARGGSPASHRAWRGARLARREEQEYREYLRDEQRRQAGCIAGRMQWDFHHGLPGAGNPSVAALPLEVPTSSRSWPLRQPASRRGWFGLLTRGSAARALVVSGASWLVAATLLLFHAALFATHVLNGRVHEPAVALRWMVGVALLGGLLAFRRLGVPLLWGRRAVGLWLLVVLLHCHALATSSDGLPREVWQRVAGVVVQVTATSCVVGAGVLLLWILARRRLTFSAGASRGYADRLPGRPVITGGHLLPLAARPPPLL